MALTLLNTYAVGNVDLTNLMAVSNSLFNVSLTLTHMTDTTVPAIAAGSTIEVNGALLKAETEEAISTTDPHTSATVADGTVYAMVDGTNKLAYFTATAPTWSDAKQGWYGTTTWAGWKYLGSNNKNYFGMTKATASYSNKYTVENSNNFLLKSEIVLLTGLLSNDSNAWAYADYPPGFTKSNTYILSALFYNSNSGAFELAGNINGILVSNQYIYALQCYLQTSQIFMQCTWPAGANYFQNQAYKVLIMKI